MMLALNVFVGLVGFAAEEGVILKNIVMALWVLAVFFVILSLHKHGK